MYSEKSRLLRFDLSRGIRTPKPLQGAVIITPLATPRAGWAESAAKFGPRDLLDVPSPTRFDDREWVW